MQQLLKSAEKNSALTAKSAADKKTLLFYIIYKKGVEKVEHIHKKPVIPAEAARLTELPLQRTAPFLHCSARLMSFRHI